MTKKNIKMIVCDIDDTLVQKELHLSQRMIHIIEQLKESNIYFTFATGRMPYRVKVFAGEAKLTIPYVANNGSILYDNGHMVSCKYVKASILKTTLQRFMKENSDLTVIFSYEDRERPLEQTLWIRERIGRYKGYDETLGNTDEIWDQEVHKVYIVDDKRTGLMSQIVKELEPFTPYISCYQYGEYSAEIVSKGCSKASGVESLIQHMNINWDEIMAIGDHSNDMELVKKAGIGVAVANAQPMLKEVADYITGKEREEGVIEAINQFVLKREG